MLKPVLEDVLRKHLETLPDAGEREDLAKQVHGLMWQVETLRDWDAAQPWPEWGSGVPTRSPETSNEVGGPLDD